ncbi:hypothetical protein ACHAW5_001928 [Stephanodiscus triporus]|uniref:Protein kinase domain-containing protein n=1 Tax=Stephanodiscus triporus TaxID=2934178 RepID=A0ABD3MMR3_9STRA
MASNYEVGRFLGKGSFATVHLARDVRTRAQCAIKIVDVAECERRRRRDGGGEGGDVDIDSLLTREVDVHSSVSSHPNVVRLLESFGYVNGVTGGAMKALVMELCPLGDLQDYLRRVRDDRRRRGGTTTATDGFCASSWLLPEGTFLKTGEIRHALSQVLCGLSFLHARAIVHRDIKASNVFLSPSPRTTRTTAGGRGLLDCTLKLGDFGLAVTMRDDDDWCEARRTFCGTPTCLAPEVVSQSVFLPASAVATGEEHDGPAGPSRASSRRTGGKKSLDGGNGSDSLVVSEASSSSSLVRRSESEKIAGYGQPADLWSTGCLLYTLIVGHNPFAVPVVTASGTRRRDEGATQTMSEEEKTRRIRQIVDRVIRGDWSIPANVRITDESLEGLLGQLLEGQPRKRGTARGILNLHPFFRKKSVTSTTSLTKRMVNREFISLNEGTGVDDRNDMRTPEQTITDSKKKQMLDKENVSNENAIKMSEGIQSVENFQGLVNKGLHNSQMHLPSPRGTFNSEKPRKLASYTSLMDDVSPKNQQDKDSIYCNVYESQGTTTRQQYEHTGAEKREQRSSIISSWSLSSSLDVLRDETFASECNQSVKEMARKQSAIQDAIDVKKPETRPFISMKALHLLPQKKYSWREPPRDGIRSSDLTVFFLGKDGLVIQKESGISHGLWMHVTSDGLGILWGNLQSRSRRSNQHNLNERSSLWLEAYSRAPEEFSKRSLVSLLSLKCHDIISLYETLERVVRRVKSVTPLITLHLYTTNKSSGRTSREAYSNDYLAKTMLMGNDPLPDIETEFADGTTIRLSSVHGRLTVKGDHGTSQLEINQERFFSSLRADRSPPPSCGGAIPGFLKPSPKFVHNLCLFIESARECLLLGDRLYLLLGGHTGPTAQARLGSRQTNHDYYPVVRKIVMYGWRREEWVVDDSSNSSLAKGNSSNIS